jgi:hypothetical protein
MTKAAIYHYIDMFSLIKDFENENFVFIFSLLEEI